MRSWVIVADNARARLFTVSNLIAPLAEIKDFVHMKGRMHESEITSYVPGRRMNSLGTSQHAVERKHSPHEKEAAVFAGEVVSYLDEGRKMGLYEQLIVIAPPVFLGLLRSHFCSELKKMVALELPKDLTKLKAIEIRDYLPNRLPTI